MEQISQVSIGNVPDGANFCALKPDYSLVHYNETKPTLVIQEPSIRGLPFITVYTTVIYYIMFLRGFLCFRS